MPEKRDKCTTEDLFPGTLASGQNAQMKQSLFDTMQPHHVVYRRNIGNARRNVYPRVRYLGIHDLSPNCVDVVVDVDEIQRDELIVIAKTAKVKFLELVLQSFVPEHLPAQVAGFVEA